MLYEVAIVLNPTEDEVKRGKNEEILLMPTCVVAQNTMNAAIKAANSCTDDRKMDDRAEVFVRPFK